MQGFSMKTFKDCLWLKKGKWEAINDPIFLILSGSTCLHRKRLGSIMLHESQVELRHWKITVLRGHLV